MPGAPHILIAHDHDLLRAFLPQLVARIYPPAAVTVVADGLALLDTYRQYGADLVIISEQIVGMRGTDLICALRAHQAACPILMISSDEAIKFEALKLGANHFLNAPFGLEDFRYALTSLLLL
jgi:DNA-binding response OmpR family regulator